MSPDSRHVSLAARVRTYETRIVVKYVIKANGSSVRWNEDRLMSRTPPSMLTVTGVGEAFLWIGAPDLVAPADCSILEAGATRRGKFRLPIPLEESGVLPSSAITKEASLVTVPIHELVIAVQYALADRDHEKSNIHYAIDRARLKETVLVTCQSEGIHQAEHALVDIFGDGVFRSRAFALSTVSSEATASPDLRNDALTVARPAAVALGDAPMTRRFDRAIDVEGAPTQARPRFVVPKS